MLDSEPPFDYKPVISFRNKLPPQLIEVNRFEPYQRELFSFVEQLFKQRPDKIRSGVEQVLVNYSSSAIASVRVSAF